MNPEADGGTATVSKIYNQAHACKQILVFTQSPLDCIASPLAQPLSASTYPGNKKRFVEDILIGACRTDFSILAGRCSRPELWDALPDLAPPDLLKA